MRPAGKAEDGLIEILPASSNFEIKAEQKFLDNPFILSIYG